MFEDLTHNDIALCGVPLDFNSSYLAGARKAPAAIRDAISCDSANSFSELGQDTGFSKQIKDSGDIHWADNETAFGAIKAAVAKIAQQGAKPLILGGDHSITYPILQGLAAHHPSLTILHFDAHSDLYDEFDNNRHSHACPFARIMEDSLAQRLIQMGIRTLTQHQREQVARFAVEVHEMKDWSGVPILDLQTPVYVTIDLDALDPAFAPGVSHYEPGGLSVRDIINTLHSINAPIIGADIVEYNPDRDINNMTAMVAARLYKELVGKMLELGCRASSSNGVE